MGGWEAYVWAAFGLAAVAMLAMVFVTLRSLKRSQRTLAQLQSLRPDA